MIRRLAMVGAALALLHPASAHGDPVTRSTLGWMINGIVSDVARAGDVAFVGGSFATVAPSANLVFNFAAFSLDSAVPVLPRLDANGRIRVVAALPAGGWLIGGEFTAINGLPRQHLARLTAAGALDTAFSAAVNDTVWALAVSGSTVYLGGDFTQVAGATREGLAAIDGGTGALVTAFAPSVPDGAVYDIVVNASTVYFGGDFYEVNGEPRANVAAVLAANGSLVPGFDADADGIVVQLILNGTDLYAAGDFLQIGGVNRTGVARLASGTGGAIASFNAFADGPVYALALSGPTLYAGGVFAQIGGQNRAHIAALNANTGAATGWNPGADGAVIDLALAGTNLIAAGEFSEAAGVERLAVAMLDTTKTTGIATTWNPGLGNGADYVHLDAAGNVFVGGSFHNYGAVRRDNLAAIDLLSGELLPWHPFTDGWVHALEVRGNVVYFGGDFTLVSNTPRGFVAAVDAVTGALLPWNPGPDGPVRGIASTPAAVYFVGPFTQLAGGLARGRGAAAAGDGTVLAWNPAANESIETLFVDGERVIVGGSFTALGGLPRARLGAVDAAAGAVSMTFVCAVNDTVYRVAVQNGLVFFGGGFDFVNGATRPGAAAVRSAPGAAGDCQLAGWNPGVDGPVYDLEASGGLVYLAGGFVTAGGLGRPGIAVVDALESGGAPAPWSPSDVSGGSVSAVDVSNGAVLFGGLLSDQDGINVGAVLYPESSLAGSPRPPTNPDLIVRGSSVRLEWGAPPLGARPLAYIIEGGSGPGRSDLASFSTGSTATAFSASGLAPGTYFVRMRSLNGAGVSAASGEQSFVVGSTGCSGPPAAPLDLKAAVNGSTVTFSWRAPVQSIAGVYRLMAGTTSGSSNIGTFEVGAATSFAAAPPPGAYFVRAIAVNGCGVSVPSGEATVIIGGGAVPPGAPFALDASVSGSTVALAWSPPSTGTGPFTYRVEAGGATGLSNLASVASSQPSFTATGVPPGVYYVRVRAAGPGGTGPAGNEVVVVVP